MKSWVWSLLLAMLAASPASAAPPGSPLLGRWAVEVDRLPLPPAARPKSVTISFAVPARGRLTSEVEIVAPDGSVRRMRSTAALDGPAVSIAGDQTEADSAAVRMPVPGVVVLALGKARHPASTRIYTLARDAATMVETAVSWDDEGRPVVRTNYFRRLRDAR
ncbi:hypothetical protein HMF7854_10460 [Sphingomonas ginkgonis]|uniref:LuxR family transcriptional regulator n=1 Tax=Sphingomonas ginkgonis TaxID=2315330 RepID=A0A3R9X8E2_9SPHN|nr:hypothetical protein [Sphingomonas ginkgonis]RST31212.1 hypothetical protein HMF7854_10460 [Sphingomonas ginkgonis]